MTQANLSLNQAGVPRRTKSTRMKWNEALRDHPRLSLHLLRKVVILARLCELPHDMRSY